MIKLTEKFIIKNKKGWHARPCSRVVRLLKSYPNVNVFFEQVGCASARASGSSIFELMKLGLNYGDEVSVILLGKKKIELKNLFKKLIELADRLAYEEEQEEIALQHKRQTIQNFSNINHIS